jgi:chromosome segregation ATPase
MSTDPRATRTITTATFPDEEVVGDKDKQIAYLSWLLDYRNDELSLGRASRSSLERELAKRETMISELIIEKETAESAMNNLARKLAEAEQEAIGLQQQLNGREKDIERLRSGLRMANACCDIDRGQVQQKDKEIASLRSQLADRDRTIARLQQESKILAANLEQCEAKADAPENSPMGETDSRRCDADDLATTAKGGSTKSKGKLKLKLRLARNYIKDLEEQLAGANATVEDFDKMLAERDATIANLRSLGNAACKTGHDAFIRLNGIILPAVTLHRIADHKAALEAWRAATRENPQSNGRSEAVKKFDEAITKHSENY